MKILNFDELVALAAEDPILFQKKYKSNVDIFSVKGIWGENIFHYLCIEGYEESVRIMIEMGADVNTKNSSGETPLSVCSFIENTPIVEILLKNGADPNICNKYGETALHKAYENPKNSTEKNHIISLLLSYGADPLAVDNLGLKPFES